MFPTIFHPTDLSEASIPALKTAHDLAKELGSKLIVCYVAHPPVVANGQVLTDPKTGESRDIAAEVESHQPSDPKVAREIQVLLVDPSAGPADIMFCLGSGAVIRCRDETPASRRAVP